MDIKVSIILYVTKSSKTLIPLTILIYKIVYNTNHYLMYIKYYQETEYKIE